MSLPFADLDLSAKYIQHDVPIYCHNHPTEPDGMNACVKEIESRLKAFEFTEAVTDHTQLQNIGTNTHAQIDTHLAAAGSHALIGEIRMLSHSTLPDGWLLCNGQTILRSSALGQLYQTLGYPHGVGDGNTTCNVPNMAYRFPYGANTNDQIGDTGGTNLIQLTSKQLPGHTHSESIPYSSSSGSGNTFVRGGTQEGTIALTTGSTGSGGSLEYYPPHVYVMYIVYAGV